MDNQDLLERTIAFHGHFCPGLTIGYRAALIALRELGVKRAADEEFVAICETDACGVDAVQYITGCTIGKGNLILRDWGKQVFTFGRRSDGRMIRVALRYNEPGENEGDLTPAQGRQRSLARMQTASDEELYSVTWVDAPLPGPARLFGSERCSVCGEGVMEARAHLRDGLPVCPECYGPTYTRRG